MEGIRVDLRVEAPETCPLARLSLATDGPCRTVSRNTAYPSDDTSTKEVSIKGRRLNEDDIEAVFSYGPERVYRVDCGGPDCPCDRVPALGCPLTTLRADGERLHLSFHVRDIDQLQAVVSDLRERFDGVSIERLLRGDRPELETDLVPVDRGALTARQREVLVTAYRMGYFEHPKRANASEVAAALGISRATVTQHLAAALVKLLGDLFEE